ncbi:hypothetical protein L3X38_032718 [Prunus dulcis]|uniref:Uncharacterized protein n=1 Tax=Prunus dulcis TaxID=3755 RepID=A0AAD4YW55_PRUDU|nr:hypothetical protein L3X38_032718 [Prunus dulcis]
MPNISPDIIFHQLSINTTVRPVRQKHSAYDLERYEAMKTNVDKLRNIGFIKEVDYPTWLANVVMVCKPKKVPCEQPFCPIDWNTMEVYVDDMLRGIEANPEKIEAILDMKVPKMVKDIQSLTRRVTAFTRFISKATDRCGLFFKALKGHKQSITWTAECNNTCT